MPKYLSGEYDSLINQATHLGYPERLSRGEYADLSKPMRSTLTWLTDTINATLSDEQQKASALAFIREEVERMRASGDGVLALSEQDLEHYAQGAVNEILNPPERPRVLEILAARTREWQRVQQTDHATDGNEPSSPSDTTQSTPKSAARWQVWKR